MPKDIAGLSSGVVKISVGGSHACALTNSGAVKCWGSGNVGQLGNGGMASSSTPVSVNGLSSGVASISAGKSHTCAVTTAGAVKCWGFNNYGQTYPRNQASNFYSPVDVDGMSAGAVSVSAGGYHTCAIKKSGTAKCWGANNYGQLGDNSTTVPNAAVDVVGLGAPIASISAGANHTCVVTATAHGSTAECWGSNSSGQLGDGSNTDRSTPVTAREYGVASISAGVDHTCLVTTSGAAMCWGFNFYGQLGDGTKTSNTSPSDVIGLGSGVESISAGSGYSCAVTTSGTAKCWGSNRYGQLGDDSSTDRLTPVDVKEP